jgi:hypothetical protein
LNETLTKTKINFMKKISTINKTDMVIKVVLFAGVALIIAGGIYIALHPTSWGN